MSLHTSIHITRTTYRKSQLRRHHFPPKEIMFLPKQSLNGTSTSVDRNRFLALNSPSRLLISNPVNLYGARQANKNCWTFRFEAVEQSLKGWRYITHRPSTVLNISDHKALRSLKNRGGDFWNLRALHYLIVTKCFKSDQTDYYKLFIYLCMQQQVGGVFYLH